MTLVVVPADEAEGEPCLWHRSELDARSLIEVVGADSALGRTEPTRRPKWARWAVVNRQTPPAPRRPVAGWVKVGPGHWMLAAGVMTAWVYPPRPPSYPGVPVREVRGWEVGARSGYVATADGEEAAQLAAEDALLAVLTDAAAALGKRVVS